MEWLQAVILGIVQGATEFIPVSSSGHLVLVPYLAGWERPGLAFDVALHMGSALAIVAYFRRELVAMLRGVLGGSSPDALVYRKVALLVVVASVPVAIAGLTLMEVFEAAFATPPLAAGFLFVTAATLMLGEALRSRRIRRAADQKLEAAEHAQVWTGDWVGGEIDAEPAEPDVPALPMGEDPTDPTAGNLATLSVRQALTVGLAQCLALFPGVSRSGTTIVAGMAAGLTREAATRFSFLISLPALAGAGILSLGDLRQADGVYATSDVVLGVLAATIASYLAIRFLVALVSRDRLTPFARYCIGAGCVGLLGYLMLGPATVV